jgi:hypothetical protein
MLLIFLFNKIIDIGHVIWILIIQLTIKSHKLRGNVYIKF